MTYAAVSQAARDEDLRNRIAACIATENIGGMHPLAQADQIQWRVAGAVADEYSYAVASNVESPGKDLGVIPDATLRTAVLDALGVIQ